MKNETVLFTSKIVSEFNGWSGETEFEFKNGQKWKQIGRQYCFINGNVPIGTIVFKDGGHWLIVSGFEVPVKKIL